MSSATSIADGVRGRRPVVPRGAGISSPSSGRLWVKLAATFVLRPVAVLLARRVERHAPLRLNLGCGPKRLPGWANVDLAGRLRVDLPLDVRKRLPFRSGSVDAIFSEHLIEHLCYEDVQRLAAECARVLRPGGVVRFVTPDFGRYACAYAAGDRGFLEGVRPNRPSPLFAVADVVYGHGHRSIWDAEALAAVLRDAGLTAAECDAGNSRLTPCPDDLNRAPESLYVEAVHGEEGRAAAAG